jgi:hypothetical protein
MTPAALTVVARVTIYLKHWMLGNIVKIECTAVDFAVRPFAQYENAVCGNFRPKGCRKDRSIDPQYSNASLLVLPGWGHPDPANVFDVVSESADVRTEQSRYRSHDARWLGDFSAKIDAYMERTGVRPLADYRGHTAGPRTSSY